MIESEQPPQESAGESAPGPESTELEPPKKKKKGLGSRRGIETLFRTSYRTHIDLSSIADTKANIMISINGIIISIGLVTISSGLAVTWRILAPLTIMLLTCLIATVYAVLAARPRMSGSSISSLEDIQRTNSSILFFGNFVNLSKQEYVQGMKEVLKETDQVYTNMILDLYGLGTVLERKFDLLRRSYTIFMVGLVLTVLLFLAFHLNVGSPFPVEGLN